MSSGGHSCVTALAMLAVASTPASTFATAIRFIRRTEGPRRDRIPGADTTEHLGEAPHRQQWGGPVDDIDPQRLSLVCRPSRTSLTIRDDPNPAGPNTSITGLAPIAARRRRTSPRRPRNGSGVAPGVTKSTESEPVDATTAAICAARLPLTVNAGTQPTWNRLGSVSTRARRSRVPAPLRPVCEPRREVHCITHHRVGPSPGMADVGGENHTDVGAGATSSRSVAATIRSRAMHRAARRRRRSWTAHPLR